MYDLDVGDRNRPQDSKWRLLHIGNAVIQFCHDVTVEYLH